MTAQGSLNSQLKQGYGHFKTRVMAVNHPGILALGTTSVIDVLPSEILEFPPDGKDTCIKLRALSTSSVAFRVRTNRPRSYTATPSHGTIPANESMTVVIVNKLNGPPNSKDKFLIESFPIADDAEITLGIWKDLQMAHDPKNGKPSFFEKTLLAIEATGRSLGHNRKLSSPEILAEIKEKSSYALLRRSTANSDDHNPDTKTITRDQFNDMIRKLEEYEKLVEYSDELSASRAELLEKLDVLGTENSRLSKDLAALTRILGQSDIVSGEDARAPVPISSNSLQQTIQSG